MKKFFTPKDLTQSGADEKGSTDGKHRITPSTASFQSGSPGAQSTFSLGSHGGASSSTASRPESPNFDKVRPLKLGSASYNSKQAAYVPIVSGKPPSGKSSGGTITPISAIQSDFEFGDFSTPAGTPGPSARQFGILAGGMNGDNQNVNQRGKQPGASKTGTTKKVEPSTWMEQSPKTPSPPTSPPQSPDQTETAIPSGAYSLSGRFSAATLPTSTFPLHRKGRRQTGLAEFRTRREHEAEKDWKAKEEEAEREWMSLKEELPAPKPARSRPTRKQSSPLLASALPRQDLSMKNEIDAGISSLKAAADQGEVTSSKLCRRRRQFVRFGRWKR